MHSDSLIITENLELNYLFWHITPMIGKFSFDNSICVTSPN